MTEQSARSKPEIASLHSQGLLGESLLICLEWNGCHADAQSA
jgi:hypothetical protein